ncbi:MAG: hypothetical protein Q7J98_00155 [Kiritimatiellia bacterium]|nr:hypothetical protein [Kiritimatiellia bacterium]
MNFLWQTEPGKGGRKEVLVATSSGLIIALNGRCETRWSSRLPAPTAVNRYRGAGWLPLARELN